MEAKRYIKRAIKYIIKEHKPINLTLEIVQKTPTQMFQGKRILITGGAKGLGLAIAKKCAQEGAEVIITGRNEETLKKAQKDIGKANYILFDNMNIGEIKCFIDQVDEKFGKIDCLINNAGISLHEGEFRNVTIKGFEDQMKTNLESGYFLAKAYIQKIEEKRQSEGNIIFISSERGEQCDDIPYGLTKVALNSLTRGLSRRVYKQGIRVNSVAPGVTASDMTNIDRNDNLYCDDNASARYFLPEEVAEIVSFLISDISKCISGEVIHCNAGNHLNPWFEK